MTTNQTAHRLLLFFLFISLLQLRAEPKNVMVDDLTFTRPENWKWSEPPAQSTAVTCFLVPHTNGTGKMEVRFYLVKKDYSNERDALSQQFPESKPGDLHEQQVRIGKRTIIYFQITGTYVFHQAAPQSDQSWIGAAIPRGDQYVYARIKGPRSDVEAAVPTFKKMVEDAVSEREEDSAVQ